MRFAGFDQTISAEQGETPYYTKVVTQFLQFLSDHRVGDTLDAHVDLNDLNEEQEGFELAEAS